MQLWDEMKRRNLRTREAHARQSGADREAQPLQIPVTQPNSPLYRQALGDIVYHFDTGGGRKGSAAFQLDTSGRKLCHLFVPPTLPSRGVCLGRS